MEKKNSVSILIFNKVNGKAYVKVIIHCVL